MSQKSLADALDIECQQESLLVGAGKAPRSRWRRAFLVLKAYLNLISTANDTEIKACAVEDQDVESQQLVLLDTGKTPRRRWHSVYFVVKVLQVFSRADKTVMETQLRSTEIPDTREPELTQELLVNNERDNREATDVVLQRIVGMTMEKDLSSLQEFGGVQGVAEALNTDMVNGIPVHEEDLHNQRTPILKPESEAHNRRFIHFLGKSCCSFTIFLLMILAILSVTFGIEEKGLRKGWYEGALTLGAVILIVIVQSICEFRNESSLREVHVLRGGCSQTICISDVLWGDIVLLEKGDKIPAYGLLVPTESLEVSGQADAIVNNQNPFLFYGSNVIGGAGKMLVTSVCAETQFGITMGRKRTPVEKQLKKLSTMKQRITVVIAIIIIVVLFLRCKLKKEHENSGLTDFSGKSHSLKELLEAIKRVALRPSGMLNMLTSFTLILVGIAEGVPLAMTIAITCWNKTMLGDKIVARDPSITVTMGSVTAICIDETGGPPLTPQEMERSDEGNLTMLGLLGLNRTSGEDTRKAIKACREAGIEVLLVSSEKVSMPQSIATEIEVRRLDSGTGVITGESFRTSSVEERMDMAAGISVTGPSFPSDRLLLMSYLKDQGHTVAVVGNRTNDIPMLKAADVGLIFATWSAEIARKSADIVIAEGNFTSILAIIKCGRCVHGNLRKYIQFQLTMTLAGLLIPLITDVSHGSSPITTVQLHWAISVLTLLGGLALLTEPPGDMLMKKLTPGADKALITKAMWVNIFIQAAYQASLLATIQSKGPTILWLNKRVIETAIFNSFFLCQVFNMFNAREPEKKNIFGGVHHRKWFWVGVVAALLLQIEYLVTAHAIAGDPRLTYAEWGMCLLVGIISWCIDLAGKCILLMIKKWVTKPPGSAVGDNRNLSSAFPEPTCILELPQAMEKLDKVD